MADSGKTELLSFRKCEFPSGNSGRASERGGREEAKVREVPRPRAAESFRERPRVSEIVREQPRAAESGRVVCYMGP